MATFEDLMQKMVNSDYDTLLAMARQALSKLIPACKEVDTENEGMLMLTALLLSSVGADGVLTATEKRFLCDLLNMTNEKVDKLIKLYNPKYAELVDRFADSMSDDIKANTLMLVTAIAACDEKISREETAFIRKLMV